MYVYPLLSFGGGKISHLNIKSKNPGEQGLKSSENGGNAAPTRKFDLLDKDWLSSLVLLPLMILAY